MSYIERESLLIDVDSLISMMHVQAKGEPIQESAIKLVETTRDYIASFPAADVAEVRHGRLISTGYDELYCEFGNCTVCGADNPIYNKFCGQCGARMDKEDEHETG